jgi:hypothetical protein
VDAGSSCCAARIALSGCGALSAEQEANIRALSLERLEALAVGEAFSAGFALLDFKSPAELVAWLAAG